MRHHHTGRAVHFDHVAGSPLPAEFSVSGSVGDRLVEMIEDRFYGYTIITYLCLCGEVWTTKQRGRAVAPS